MSPLIVALAAFVGVSALVVGVALLFRKDSDDKIADRLQMLTGGSAAHAKKALAKSTVLAAPLEDVPNLVESFLSRFGKFSRLFEQANTRLTMTRFMAISGLSALGGGVAFTLSGMPATLIPVMAACAGLLPLVWLLMRRRSRLKKFAAQLPGALELIARALRAGHSLAAGFDLVAREMPEPISSEFGRAFEEQNLGIPLEEAMEGITERVPNLDLKFFVTAVILQRQTGGDLSEILDKIGRLIRERFQVWGQVQALTGEGRLSGIVLLALPPVLFIAVYRLNPEYMMVLFTDDMGKKMLIGAVLSQLFGAIVIRKIVNIKV